MTASPSTAPPSAAAAPAPAATPGQDAAAFYESFWADADYTLRYAWDAARRDRFPAIKAVTAGLAPFARVLDFGCGNGVLTAWMHENGLAPEIIGYDVSETGVAYAAKSFARPGLSFARFDPALGLPEGARGFDAIIASHVLEHVPDPAACVRDLATRAQWLVLEVPVESAAVPNAYYRLTGRDRLRNPVGHLHFWSRASFISMLEGAGLTVERVHHYASAPFSPFTARWKRAIEQVALRVLGLPLYARLMATHLCVLARAAPPAPRAG
ncbi:MAG: class I SAM-dependent methyltransferase [Alphaproteobacteria bacterium]|nr:class I SAM-dependent methyltransferase [Alphaproteobacteria bacterium]